MSDTTGLSSTDKETIKEWIDHPGYAIYRKYVDGKKDKLVKMWFQLQDPIEAENYRLYAKALETFFEAVNGVIQLRDKISGEQSS